MSLQKSVQLAVCAAAVCVLLYFFPLVRIRTLDSGFQSNFTSNAHNGTTLPLDISTFVDTLWNERIPVAAANAPTVDEVLTMSKTDASGARKRFGREVGLGGPTFFFLRGRGQIESVNEDECRLVIAGQSPRVSLEIGILVSNAVRDATGLVSVADFPDSQDFNKLSVELNSRCESVIQQRRNQLVVGATVDFVGCGEVRDNGGFDPLKLVPIQLNTIPGAELTE